MCNSYKKVSDIINDAVCVNSFVVNANKYFAHTPTSDFQVPETLKEHIDLVLHYLDKIVEAHSLDVVLDNLISEYLAGVNDSQKLGDQIKNIFVQAIAFHDYGKVNENFQAASNKMNNPNFIGKEIPNSPISTHHSSLGAFIFICKQLDEIYIEFPKSQHSILTIAILFFSYPIFKHHSKFLSDKWESEIYFSKDTVTFLQNYLNNFNFSFNINLLITISKLENLLNHSSFRKHINSFSLYSLVRLNHSLLTAADYLATNEFMSNYEINDFGVLSLDRIEQIYSNVTQKEWINEDLGKRNFNKDIYRKIKNYQFVNPKSESGDSLNILRQEMAVEVIKNVRANWTHNLFYIEAPTGGGKTNLSMLATIELLKHNKGKINKVFYVFPFTTLITQTYQSLNDTLSLNESEIIEVHSKAGFKNENDDNYGKEKQNYIDNLFINYPFCLLTHIKFFDILKTNEKGLNYILHRIVNSVVVIDELQSYNPTHWDKIIYFIKKYAKAYNIKFILMSATLPKLDKLKVSDGLSDGFVYLIPYAKKNYFQNPNFCNRVSFNFDLLDFTNITYQKIANRLLEESKRYSELDFGDNKPQNSVYTIIEFIFKKAASEFYEVMQNQSQFFDEILLLSGTILEHRRKQIINTLKNKSNRKKRILLITTQVVEAGVDIDMDLGFKDISLIDSDEQLAGRINRNVNKKNCTLFLFNFNKEQLIYGNDKRLSLSRKYIDRDTHKQILEKKDFDLLYDLVLNDRNEWNALEMAEGFLDYKKLIDGLRFKSVNESFKLINQENITCFIPLEIPIAVCGAAENSLEKVFSNSEQKFLAENSIFPNERQCVCGKDVFELFLEIIRNKVTFTSQQIRVRVMQGILSKFVISLFATPKIQQQIILFSDEEKSNYGYKYLERWSEFYSETYGMNDKQFYSNETQFM